MPDTIESPPIPDAPETASNTGERKPGRKRGLKAKKTAATTPRPERTRARPTTLLARLKALGEYHVAAYRALWTRDFDKALRAEFKHKPRLAAAERRVERAEAELVAARAALEKVAGERFADGDAYKTLHELARKIAEARGDTLGDDADADIDFPNPAARMGDVP